MLEKQDGNRRTPHPQAARDARAGHEAWQKANPAPAMPTPKSQKGGKK